MYPALRKHFAELAELTDEEYMRIAACFREKRFKKHSIILQPGDTVNHEYFVIKGLLKTFLVDDNGKEHILQFSMENWWASDYQALHNDTPSSFTIQCLENVELLYISYDDRKRLCNEIWQYERFCRLKVTAGFISMQSRVMALLKNDAQSRYQQLLNQYPTLFQRVPKALIAAYLGVTRETLSRLHM
ncbi:Crp/Fnr family transcriptional regulator [Chitinophaga rhizophila]|uniref:Crp/Fnr family transcriptional regulator n=1 Tax=Chitinophaga rhizophila TaxID=2866212 RepID=A0ABS7GMW0_9BACT|nr:Crp/Fnr family transcriptional regulator [Chitinophaga rhizophila]MBW8688364.1 Crp/Fnr family transcriptional regulator [Chitinophaga rhizophila]